jgi:hypothetical protein
MAGGRLLDSRWPLVDGSANACEKNSKLAKSIAVITWRIIYKNYSGN